MNLEFINLCNPQNLEDLTESEKKQLLVVGKLYHGVEYPIEKILCSEDDENYDEEITLFQPEIWDVIDENKELKYKLYLYMVDSGTLFEKNSINVIGEIIQFGFEDYSSERINKYLLEAQKKAENTIKIKIY